MLRGPYSQVLEARRSVYVDGTPPKIQVTSEILESQFSGNGPYPVITGEAIDLTGVPTLQPSIVGRPTIPIMVYGETAWGDEIDDPYETVFAARYRAFSLSTDPLGVNNPPNGSWTLRVRAADRLGNEVAEDRTVQFTGSDFVVGPARPAAPSTSAKTEVACAPVRVGYYTAKSVRAASMPCNAARSRVRLILKYFTRHASDANRWRIDGWTVRHVGSGKDRASKSGAGIRFRLA